MEQGNSTPEPATRQGAAPPRSSRWRFPASLASLALTSATMYGGQAVIEGVMMRGPHFFAVACRRANGEIVTTCEAVPKILRPQWQKLPFLRGAFALVDSMALGTRALFWAAKIAEQDTVPISPKGSTPAESTATIPHQAGGTASVPLTQMPGAPIAVPEDLPEQAPSKTKVADIAIGSAMVIGLASAIFLFKILPQFGLEALKRFGWETWQLGLADFVVRFTIFTGYILLVSRMEYVYRVFQYHGAEHKAINALEAGEPLTVENAAAASRLHPRCGTSFLVIVIFLSVLAIAPFYGLPLWMRILIQLAALFPVAGVSFELLRLAGKYRNNPVASFLSRPGMWTQLLTTREPDKGQVEVSIAALKAVMDAEEREKRQDTPPAEPASEPAESVA
ncbi:MAG: DUF1385 domain-containing protein [Armatimonadaceae bacterium]